MFGIDTNDVQVVGAGSAGIGSYYLPLSQMLQISISVTTLVFICCKLYFLIKNKNGN